MPSHGQSESNWHIARSRVPILLHILLKRDKKARSGTNNNWNGPLLLPLVPPVARKLPNAQCAIMPFVNHFIRSP